MSRRSFARFIVLGLGIAGCGEHIDRMVALRFRPGVPSADSFVVGDSLRIRVTHMEPFGEGKQLVAWARAKGKAVRLGAVALGEPAMFVGRALGLNWAEVDELLLTQEGPAQGPTAPSATVHFHGAPGGPFESALVEAALAPVVVTAEIADRTLRVEHGELPFPGVGRYYGVWVLRESDHDRPAERVFLGALSLAGPDSFEGDESLAAHREVVITVELESGVDAPALASVVFRGAIPTGLGAEGEKREEAPEHGH